MICIEQFGMRNIGKRVESAGQKCANMGGNAVLLAFILVLGFRCWQVCDSHRRVTVTGVWQSQVCAYTTCMHGFWKLLALWFLRAATLVERCQGLCNRATRGWCSSFQRGSIIWCQCTISKEDNTSRRPVPLPCSTEEPKAYCQALTGKFWINEVYGQSVFFFFFLSFLRWR